MLGFDGVFNGCYMINRFVANYALSLGWYRSMCARVRAEKPRLLSVPREVSAASMLLISGIGGLVLARPSPSYFILGLSVLAIHFFTFDSAFYALRAGDTRLFLVSVIINVVPYIVVLAYSKPSLLALGFLGAALLLLVAHLVVEKIVGPGSELEYIVGSSIPVLPAATIPSLLGPVNRWVAVYWLLLTIYAVATAAYVEAHLPWRRTSPWLAIALFIPSWILVVTAPYVSVALVEPTISYLLYAFRPKKITPQMLRRLGRRTLVRLLLFSFLVLVALYYQ